MLEIIWQYLHNKGPFASNQQRVISTKKAKNPPWKTKGDFVAIVCDIFVTPCKNWSKKLVTNKGIIAPKCLQNYLLDKMFTMYDSIDF